MDIQGLEMNKRKLFLWIMLLLLCCMNPSCNWKNINVNIKEENPEFNFCLPTSQGAYVIRTSGEDNYYSITLNAEKTKKIPISSRDGREITDIIQQFIDLGEYRKTIKWHQHPLFNAVIERDALATVLVIFPTCQTYKWYVTAPQTRERVEPLYNSLKVILENVFQHERKEKHPERPMKIPYSKLV